MTRRRVWENVWLRAEKDCLFGWGKPPAFIEYSGFDSRTVHRQRDTMDPMDRVFDWQPRFDEESRNFPIRSAIPATPPRKRNKLWRVGPILDQGREGACVGFGWTAELLATPVAVKLDRVKAVVPSDPQRFARETYLAAQRIDEWEGEQYEGTSVLAGAKVLHSLGLLKEYRWAFSIEDVVDAVLAKGPVVLGIPWYSGMYETDQTGVLKVDGSIVGGHCITAVGYRHKADRLDGADGVILQNSWGPDWGINGLGLIRVNELADLLRANGEACVPSKRSYGRG